MARLLLGFPFLIRKKKNGEEEEEEIWAAGGTALNDLRRGALE